MWTKIASIVSIIVVFLGAYQATQIVGIFIEDGFALNIIGCVIYIICLFSVILVAHDGNKN